MVVDSASQVGFFSFNFFKILLHQLLLAYLYGRPRRALASIKEESDGRSGRENEKKVAVCSLQFAGQTDQEQHDQETQ